MVLPRVRTDIYLYLQTFYPSYRLSTHSYRPFTCTYRPPTVVCYQSSLHCTVLSYIKQTTSTEANYTLYYLRVLTKRKFFTYRSNSTNYACTEIQKPIYTLCISGYLQNVHFKVLYIQE